MNAMGCVSLVLFIEETRRSQFVYTRGPLKPVGVGSQLTTLNLSSSAVVSLPIWFNTFVRLKWLFLKDCKQLQEIPELPPSVEMVYLVGCTSLERLPFNNIYNSPMLEWIDLSDCPERIRNDLQIHLVSEGHPQGHRFGCIFPGNKIPDYLSHGKEVSNTKSHEIDINEPMHLDSENTRFVFFAVIGTEDVQDEASFQIWKVINNVSHCSYDICISSGSDHVWLHYLGLHHSQVEADNIRLTFKCVDEFGNPSKERVVS
ncbi:disease resistance protein RML1B-like [Corylus avellana]|uniref:disease resistance protein RML1B-like n=1 Tax=Corylus avellana TaxID=13451 RepID=UPI00286BA2CB|nr:disease resistance protein RML1B-like [Corylus avellana]